MKLRHKKLKIHYLQRGTASPSPASPQTPLSCDLVPVARRWSTVQA